MLPELIGRGRTGSSYRPRFGTTRLTGEHMLERARLLDVNGSSSPAHQAEWDRQLVGLPSLVPLAAVLGGGPSGRVTRNSPRRLRDWRR